MPIEIRMPRLTDSMTQGTVISWRKQVGELVRAGEPVAEIEVDKATVDLESPHAGTLAKIVVPAGTEKVEVGCILAVLDEAVGPLGASKTASRTAEKENGHPVEPVPVLAESPAPAVAHRAMASLEGGEVNVSPLARSMASQTGINLAGVMGTGPGGRVNLADVKTALGLGPDRQVPTKSPALVLAASITTQADPPYAELSHSRIREVTARRLSESKQTIPHFYLETHILMDAILRARAEIAARREEGIKLSINDFAIRAAALALRAVPEVNASWMEGAVRRFNRVDLAFAVATDAGLLAPVVRDADGKGLLQLSAELRDLAERAREGRLRIDELQGGTFTVSNLGMFGVDAIYPIINPPQAAILGLGAAEPRPVARNGSVVIATVMTCTLSADHRVLDGALGARFLRAFKGFIEQPMTMVL